MMGAKKKEPIDSTKIFLQAFRNDININILAILQMYHSMNITQISKLSGYSKTTVRRHLQELEELHVLSSEERPVNIQGRYTPIYYSITPETLGSPESESFNFQTASLSSIHNTIKVNKVALRNFTKYLEKCLPLLDYVEDTETLSEIRAKISVHLPNSNPDFRLLFFSEEEIEELTQIRKEYMTKVNKILGNQQKNIHSKGREFLYFDGFINLKKLFEFEAHQKRESKNKAHPLD